MNVHEELDRLRTEEPRSEAKGELILKLKRKKEQTPMKLISKLGIPTALIAVSIGAGSLMLPRTALASPETVAKAIRQVRSYIISSFNVDEGGRKLMSKTTVQDGKASRVFYDASGKPRPAGEVSDVKVGTLDQPVSGMIVNGQPTQVGKVGESGSDIVMVKNTHGHPLKGGDKPKIEVKMTKGADGKQHSLYFVNGKEVKELPKEIQGLHIDTKGGSSPTISIQDPKGNPIEKSISGFAMLGMVGKDGKISTFASGQTLADYLLKLLEDESRWTIERGVMIGGQKLDKFMLKGEVSPIELYVDPGNSLPRILRFIDIAGSGRSIEDVYDYTSPATPR